MISFSKKRIYVTKLRTQGIATLLALLFLGTACEFNKKSTLRSESSHNKTPPGHAALEEVFKNHNITSFADFYGSQGARDDYLKIAQAYFGEKYYGNGSCFKKILDDIHAATHPGGSNPEVANLISSRLWETSLPGQAHHITVSQADFGISSQKLNADTIGLLQRDTMLKLISGMDGSLDLTRGTLALSSAILRLQKDLETELGDQTSSLEQLRLQKKAVAIASGIAGAAFTASAVSGANIRKNPKDFLALWQRFHDEGIVSTARELGVHNPALQKLSLELVPDLKVVMARSGLEEEQLDKAFSELQNRMRRRVTFTVPFRRIHSILKYGFGNECETASPYFVMTTALDEAISFFAEVDQRFEGFVDLVPLAYTWRQQNQEQFEGRYLVYSPLFAGHFFNALGNFEAGSTSISYTSSLLNWLSEFAKQMPRNAAGIGAAINGTGWWRMAYPSRSALETMTRESYNQYCSLGSCVYSQADGQQWDLELFGRSSEIMHHLVDRLSPAQDPMNFMMTPDRTMLTPLLFKGQPGFQFLQTEMQSIGRTSYEYPSGPAIGDSCPLSADLLQLLDFSNVIEVKTLIRCIAMNPDFHSLTQGNKNTSSLAAGLISAVQSLAGRVLALNAESTAYLQSETEFQRRYLQILDQTISQTSPGSAPSNLFASYRDFLADLGVILGWTAPHETAINLLKKLEKLLSLSEQGQRNSGYGSKGSDPSTIRALREYREALNRSTSSKPIHKSRSGGVSP